MKKINLLLLLFVASLLSCKKNTEEKYHLSFSVDGTNKVYTGYINAHTSIGGGFTTLTIFGADSTNVLEDFFVIYLSNMPGGSPVSSREYSDTSPDFRLTASYSLKNSGIYDAGKTVAEDAAANSITIINHFKVTITSTNSETVRGTFSGDFYKGGNVQTGAKITITNGDFYAKYQ